MPGTNHDGGYCGLSAWLAQILLNGVPQHPAYALLVSATFMSRAEYYESHQPRWSAHYAAWGIS
jgi:hypothetical protein